MKKKILFIINPISGVGKQKIVESLIPKYLDTTVFDYEIAYTERPRHAKDLSANAASEKIDIVVAVGGDGTVNEVSQGLIGTETAMAIIPAGSGNGLALYLNIPLNFEKAIANINKLALRQIDTVRINDRQFVNVAGVGFDAHISHEFAAYGKRGFVSYLKIILKEFFTYKPKKYRLIINGKEKKKRSFLITFANSSQWGNNAHIAPNALIDDGYLDICFMKKFPLIVAPFIGLRMFRKTLDKSKYIKIIRAQSVEVFRKKPIEAHLDGEPVNFGLHLMIDVVPKSLWVVAS
jgi:diacylglycerol kinase (ATP)